jgi:hypothetical protein
MTCRIFNGVEFTVVFEVALLANDRFDGNGKNGLLARLHPNRPQQLMVVGEFAVAMLFGQTMRTTAAMPGTIHCQQGASSRFWTMPC